MGTKWCCSRFREPENRVHSWDFDENTMSDVREFVQELRLSEEEEEMGPVADTFHGVENLNGVFNWEGSDCPLAKKKQQQQNEQRQIKPPIQTYADLCSNQAKPGNKDNDSNWDKHMDLANGDVEMKRIELSRKLFLSFFWKRWPQKTTKKNAFELIEFAGDIGSDNNNAQSSSH